MEEQSKYRRYSREFKLAATQQRQGVCARVQARLTRDVRAAGSSAGRRTGD